MLAHLVEEQHQPGARRHRPDLGADDARRGVVALDRLVLEVVLQPVRRAAGEQAYDVVHHLLLDAAEVVEQPVDVGLVLGVLAEDVRRRVVEQRLHGLADPVEVVVVAVVGVGVVPRVPADLLDVLAVVVAEEQVVAVAGRVERRRHHQRHEAVLDQVELVDDLGAQQAERVGERREREARHELLGDRGAADQRRRSSTRVRSPAFARYAGVDQPVVAAADHDGVVRRAAGGRACRDRHGFAVFLAGLNRGIFAVRAATVVLRWLTASSRCTSVPGRRESGSHPGQADVALEDGGVHEAGGVADLGCRRRPGVARVVQHRLVGERVLVLRAAAGRRRGGAGPSAPSPRRCRRSPSATCRRRARGGSRRGPMKGRVSSSMPRSIQPMPSSVGVTRSWSVKTSRLLCHSTSMSGSPASMRSIISASSPNGRMLWPCPASSTASSTVDGVVGLDGELEAEVTGVAGAGHGDRGVGRSSPGCARSRRARRPRASAARAPLRERGPWTASMP